jgi:hypothetical protein
MHPAIDKTITRITGITGFFSRMKNLHNMIFIKDECRHVDYTSIILAMTGYFWALLEAFSCS